MRRLPPLLVLSALASLAWALPAPPVRHRAARSARGSASPIASAPAPAGLDLQLAGSQTAGSLAPAASPAPGDIARLRLSFALEKPKIVFSLNADDDLAAIRRAGFTHVVVSYLQGQPDEEQRRKLDECQRIGLKLIYRLVDLVDRDRRAGNNALVQHTVLLLRDHPALAGWETFEETNLPPAVQIAVYREIKHWDPVHPVITTLTNEYSPTWYHRTYSDDAQDVILMDYYPYKKRYNGWIYIPASVRALQAEQQRPVPIIPVLQASASAGVASAEDTLWPPPGGLEKQLNLWWSLGADAGAGFWLWRGSREFPFVGLADPQAPAYALPETEALLARIPDGELPSGGAAFTTEARRLGAGEVRSGRRSETPAVRVWQPRVNYLNNSGFERGLEGWSGYSGTAAPSGDAYTGHGAARMANAGAPKPIGVAQAVELLVPPNGAVTLSCYYKVVRETTGLQWMLGTTAYPAFGAASFLEGKERLPPGDWQRASVTATNTTGAPQHVTSVAVLSNAFTGEVLLDNFQLERGPSASEYIYGGPSRSTRLVYHLPQSRGQRRGVRARARSLSPDGVWTLSGWSAPEVPPEGDDYACLAAIEGAGASPEQKASTLELRLRVDPRRSDPNGWVGALEVAGAGAADLRMPIALAPGQPLFWALSSDHDGALTLHAAPAGYRLATVTARANVSLGSFRTISLGTDSTGGHPLNGLVGTARLTPQALPLAALERERAAARGAR